MKYNIIKTTKEYSIIALGVFIMAVGLQFFFFPNKIASGGITGFALIITHMFNIPSSIIVTIGNVILFSMAFVMISGQFGIKSIYATILLSLFLGLFEKFTPNYAFTDDLILATIFGSVFTAVGVAMIYMFEASTGGTSIIGKIIQKYFHIGYGMSNFIADAIVTILAIFSFGIELALVGLLSVYFTGFLTDKFIDGFNSSKQIMIITSQKELVVEYILKDFDRGCTILKAIGGYSGAERDILLVILDRRQFISLRKFLKENDPRAFVTVTETSKVFGEGFNQLH